MPALEDPPKVKEGDSGFLGLNMKLDVDKLPAAFLSASVNKRLRKGVAETRPGWVTPSGMTSALGYWTRIYGEFVYSNPNVPDGTGVNNNEWIVLATDTGMWLCAQGWAPINVPLPAGEAITGPVDFAEFEGVLILFRGPDAIPLAWDPGQTTGCMAAAQGFQPITQSAVTNEEGQSVGVIAMPNGSWALVFANRLFIPAPSNTGAPLQPNQSTLPAAPFDAIFASDILDYTRYDAINDEFVVNSGTNEALVALIPYQQTAIVAFKEQTIWILQNVYGDLSTATLSAVTTSMGCAARRSVVGVGGDVLFLCASPRGVYRLNTLLSIIQAAPVPVSDPVSPAIDTINWAAAGGAVATLWKEYYFLAVPVNGSITNNCILVFNTAGGKEGMGAWESIDALPAGASIDNFLVTNWDGARRLFATDHVNGRVYLYGDQAGQRDGIDQIGATWTPIADSMTTRGYALGSAVSVKGIRRINLAMGTRGSSFSVTLGMEGVAGKMTVAAVNHSRTRYDLWGVPEWNPTNANGDFGNPGREDYAVQCPIKLNPPAGTAGVQLNVVQEKLERFITRARGRWATVTVASAGGYCAVRAAEVEGTEILKGARPSL
jgi:hypothetical protein